MRHKPRRLIGDTQHAMKLMGGHTFLARTNQVICEQPLMEWNLGTLEQRADRHGELLAAVGTEPQAGTRRLALDAMRGIDDAAVRTDRAVRPANSLQVLARLVFVGVNRISKVHHGCT